MFNCSQRKTEVELFRTFQVRFFQNCLSQFEEIFSQVMLGAPGGVDADLEAVMFRITADLSPRALLRGDTDGFEILIADFNATA